jgi:hypothetical protein
MSGVKQPLLSVASGNPASPCQTPPMQRTRFMDRRGRFKQSLGQFKCVEVAVSEPFVKWSGWLTEGDVVHV